MSALINQFQPPEFMPMVNSNTALTMRDRFAMAALAIVEVEKESTDKRGAAAIAYAAYLIAYAMLKERER